MFNYKKNIDGNYVDKIGKIICSFLLLLFFAGVLFHLIFE